VRLTWTPRGIRGRIRPDETNKDWLRVSIRGAQRSYEAVLESDTEAVTLVRLGKEDRKREVQPRGRDKN